MSWIELGAVATIAIVGLIVNGNIVKRMGRPRWQGLLLIMPGVQIVFWLWLALTEWPIEKEVARLRLLNAALERKQAA